MQVGRVRRAADRQGCRYSSAWKKRVQIGRAAGKVVQIGSTADRQGCRKKRVQVGRAAECMEAQI